MSGRVILSWTGRDRWGRSAKLKSNSNLQRLVMLSTRQHDPSFRNIHIFSIKCMFTFSNKFSLGRQLKPFFPFFFLNIQNPTHSSTFCFESTSLSARTRQLAHAREQHGSKTNAVTFYPVQTMPSRASIIESPQCMLVRICAFRLWAGPGVGGPRCLCAISLPANHNVAFLSFCCLFPCFCKAYPCCRWAEGGGSLGSVAWRWEVSVTEEWIRTCELHASSLCDTPG